MDTKNPTHYVRQFEQGHLTMTIDEMLLFIDARGVIFDLIQIGYEQADCNEERFVDHGDAIRIFFDGNDDTNSGITKNLNDASRQLLGTLIRIKTAERWTREFPENKAAG